MTPAQVISVIEEHLATMTGEDEVVIDELRYNSDVDRYGQPAVEAGDLAIRTCKCGVKIDGFYEYADHLKAQFVAQPRLTGIRRRGVSPKRIQRKRTKGWRMPEGAVYVGRPSRWGNPYRVGETFIVGGVFDAPAFPVPTVREPGEYQFGLRVDRLDGPHRAVAWFHRWALVMAEKDADWLLALRGRDLVCWCPLDQSCHADVLLELANR